MQNDTPAGQLVISSTVFGEGVPIPPQYTCKGENVSPPLNIIETPAGTQSYVLIMHDPDATSDDYLHWLVWDIPSLTDTIAASSVPVGAVQGYNGNGKIGYLGPCPPKGTGQHRYIFELYALDTTLNLPKSSSRGDVTKAMQGHILASTSCTGLFGVS